MIRREPLIRPFAWTDCKFWIKGASPGDTRKTSGNFNMLFRGRKIAAWESKPGTLITSILVGGKEVIPPLMRDSWWRRLLVRLRLAKKRTPGVPSAFFAEGAMGNNLCMPTCPPGKWIEITVYFPDGGDWGATIAGECIR